MILGRRWKLASRLQNNVSLQAVPPLAINGVSQASIATVQANSDSRDHELLNETVADYRVAAPEATTSSVLKQRTEEWQELRQERLTASVFASALGFWGIPKREEIWEEKLGLREPFTGSSGTDWGLNKEAAAVQRYQEITGNKVEHLAFKIYKEGNEGKGWLGASPDGLVNEGLAGAYEDGGILEVKCPHNNGKPEFSVPWTAVPYYYIPQLQGLMEILEREWLDLCVWTLNGSAVFRVERDNKYWELIYTVLHDFWWESVVPARRSLASGDIDVNIFKPIVQHRLTPIAVKESKKLARKVLLVTKVIE